MDFAVLRCVEDFHREGREGFAKDAKAFSSKPSQSSRQWGENPLGSPCETFAPFAVK
jgi:hypothetical protein